MVFSFFTLFCKSLEMNYSRRPAALPPLPITWTPCTCYFTGPATKTFWSEKHDSISGRGLYNYAVIIYILLCVAYLITPLLGKPYAVDPAVWSTFEENWGNLAVILIFLSDWNYGVELMDRFSESLLFGQKEFYAILALGTKALDR